MTESALAETILAVQGTVDLPEASTTTQSLRAALATARAPHRQRVGELLVAAGCVNDTGVHRALAMQANHPDVRLGDQLLVTNEVQDEFLYRALSEQMGVPYARLGEFDVETAALAVLPQDIARERRCFR